MGLGCGFNACFGWGSLGGREQELTPARQGVGYLEAEYEVEGKTEPHRHRSVVLGLTGAVAGARSWVHETPGPLAKALTDPRVPPGPPGLTHVLPSSATLLPLSFTPPTVLPCGSLADLLSMQKSRTSSCAFWYL